MKATPKQRATLDSMQIQYDDEITVERASELIAAYIEKRKQMVEDFKRNNPIDAIIERYGNQQVGRDHKIFAPWRAEATPSVHIYEDGSWHDFGAGVGGDVLDYLGHFFFGANYNRESHFPDVVDRIGALDIKPLPPTATKPKLPKPRTKISLDEIMGWADNLPERYRDYWRGRGLTDNTIDRFLLGFDGWRLTIPALYRGIPFAVRRRITPEREEAARHTYDRLMQPWRENHPDLADREIITTWREQLKTEHPDWTADQVRAALPSLPPKYVGIDGDIAGLFNSDALPSATAVIFCEGEADCMLLDQLGYRAVSMTAGAGSWKDDWARFFTHVRDIYLLFDNDKAGREGAAKVHATLRRARIVTLPEGVKDVGELWATGSAASWLKENVG
jgi:DNA primase